VSEQKWQRNQDAQQVPRTVAQFQPLITKMARKFMTRAAAIRSPYEQIDYEQELVATLLRCNAAYDPEGGASFLNFFITSGWRNLARMHRIDQINMDTAPSLRIEDLQVGSDGGDGINLHETIPDTDTSSQESNVLADELLRFIVAHVSEETAHMVEFLLECPDLLKEQFDSYNAGMDRTLASGIQVKRHRQFDLGFVCRLVGMDARATKSVLQEVQAAVQRWQLIGEAA
jgi:hypothetical protein